MFLFVDVGAYFGGILRIFSRIIGKIAQIFSLTPSALALPGFTLCREVCKKYTFVNALFWWTLRIA